MKAFVRSFFWALCFYPIINMAVQWPTDPVMISTPNVEATSPQVAVNPNGDVATVWVENNVIKARTGNAGAVWDADIATLSASGASEPQVRIDNDGNAVAVWLENGVLKASSKSFGGSWSNVPDVISSVVSSDPKMDMDVAGNLIVVWKENGVIQSLWRLKGASWSNVTPVSGNGAASPSVAIGKNGTAAVVWQEETNSVSAIYAASSSLGGSWTTAQSVSLANENSTSPSVIVDSAGNITAAWFGFDIVNSIYSNVIFKSSSLPVNGSWSMPVAISSPGIRNPADLKSLMATGPNGEVLAVWSASYNGALFNIEWSLLLDEKWSAPVAIATQNLLSFDFATGTDALGNIFVTWMFYDENAGFLMLQGALNDVTGVSKIFGESWTLSNGGSNAYPVMSVTNSSNSILGALVWENNFGVNNCIQALTMQLDYLSPPTNLSVSQNVMNYGVLSELYNTFSWNASPSPNIRCYLVFRNGVYIAYLDSSQLQYIDTNRKANESVVYGVASYNNQGLESDPAIVSFP